MPNRYLWRYTELPALIHLLTERRLTLLDPQSWDDTNDSYFLALYKKQEKLETVLALCFSMDQETYHQWRVFAPGSGGVCIRFNRAPLIQAAMANGDVRASEVTYLQLDEMREKKLRTTELPFLKRHAFKHESEYRMLYTSKKASHLTVGFDVQLTCINRITLSPWLNKSLAEHMKKFLRSIKGCEGLEILRSTLIGNEEWKRYGEGAMRTIKSKPPFAGD